MSEPTPTTPAAPAAESTPDPVVQVMDTALEPGAQVSPILDAATALGLPNPPSEDIEELRQNAIGKHNLEEAQMEVTPASEAQDDTPASVTEDTPPPPDTGDATPPPAPTPVETPAQAAEAVARGQTPDVPPPAMEDPASSGDATPPEHTQTVKIGEKEYSQEEILRLQHSNDLLQKSLAAQLDGTAPAPEAVPTPADTRPPTTEEIQADREKVQTQENDWVAQNMRNMGTDVLNEDGLEEILNGGPEAVRAFHKIRQRDMARTALMVRKSMYQELSPIIDQIETAQKPIAQHHEDVQRWQAEQMMKSRHGDIGEHQMDTARQIAQKLIDTYPEETGSMGMEQFVDEVARQTHHNLNQNATALGFEKWQDTPKYSTPADYTPPGDAPVAAPAAPPAQVPHPQQIPPAPSAETPAAAQRKVAPPSTPAGMQAGSQGSNWHQSVAKSLI